jgi:hypothetical protein
LGRFKLNAHPGTYYLGGATTAVPTLASSYIPGDTVRLDFLINVWAVAEIHAGKFTEQDLEILELAPQ